jgi:hypothetical protein
MFVATTYNIYKLSNGSFNYLHGWTGGINENPQRYYASGTVANGAANTARFKEIRGMVYYNGKIYICDANVIRYMNVSSTDADLSGTPYYSVGTAFGAQPTNGYDIAIPEYTDGGSTTSQFNRVTGIVSDGNGTLYVTDTYNNVIRKIILANGTVTTYAGTPIREYTYATEISANGSIDGNGTNASFTYLDKITIDNNNNLYVADGNYVAYGFNNVFIRKIDTSRNVTKIAGGDRGNVNGTGLNAKFTIIYELIYNKDKLYINDNNTNRILEFKGGDLMTQGFDISQIAHDAPAPTLATPGVNGQIIVRPGDGMSAADMYIYLVGTWYKISLTNVN